MEPPPWLGPLRDTFDASDGPRLLTLATLSREQTPRARMLVVRDVAADGSLLVCSDARSDKNDQVRRRPVYEAVVWSDALRTQWRLNGRVEIVAAGDPARAAVWAGSSPAARGLFVWPTPGAPREPDGAFAAEPPTDPPATFEVLRLHVTSAERLDLKPTPHARTRWTRRGGGWACDPLNP